MERGMELQVPAFLVSVEEAQSGGFIDMTEVMVPIAIFPDDRDLMTRLGYLVTLGHRERRNPDFIRWRPFDQVWNSSCELRPEALTVPDE